jgi:6-phosphogluconolactonase
MSPIRFCAASTLAAGLLLALPVPILKHAPKPEYFVYVGSRDKQGIYLYRFNPNAPSLVAVRTEGPLATPLPGVNALAAHPEGRFLYAVTASSSFAAYAIQGSGSLRLLNRVQSERKDPCSITAEKKGWMLLVTYCGSGSVESFRVAGDGAIGESTGLQQHVGADAQPRAVAISPDNFFLFNPDLDKVFQYRFDPARAIFWPNDPASAAMKPGARALSLAFRPDEKFAYVADEAGSTLSVFVYNRDIGSLKLRDSLSLLPANPAAMEMDASGRFIYLAGSNNNSISVIGIDHKNGTPKILGRVPSEGKTPKQLRIDPTGRFLFALNQTSGRVTVFQIDPKTGLLSATPHFADVPEPTSIQFVAAIGEGIH